jgi:hypothetical protein
MWISSCCWTQPGSYLALGEVTTMPCASCHSPCWGTLLQLVLP